MTYSADQPERRLNDSFTHHSGRVRYAPHVMTNRSLSRVVVVVVVLLAAALAVHRLSGGVRDWLVAMHGGRGAHGIH